MNWIETKYAIPKKSGWYDAIKDCTIDNYVYYYHWDIDTQTWRNGNGFTVRIKRWLNDRGDDNVIKKLQIKNIDVWKNWLKTTKWW